MRALIGIAGRKRSGKDTLADYLVDLYGYRKRAFAEPLKAMALAIDPVVSAVVDEHSDIELDRLSRIVGWVGWDRAKEEYPEVRRFLQRLGTEGVRGTFGPNAWVDLALTPPPVALTVFTDCRFPSEVEGIIQAGGQVIRVRRPATETGDAHASETALDDMDLPTVLNDSTIPELWRRAENLLRREALTGC